MIEKILRQAYETLQEFAKMHKSYTEIQMHIPVNTLARSGKKLNGVRAIIVHYPGWTGDKIQNMYEYFSNPSRYASAHDGIYGHVVANYIPRDEVTFNCGAWEKSDKKAPENGPFYNEDIVELFKQNNGYCMPNNYTISVEACVEADGEYSKNTLNTLRKYIAQRLQENSLTIKDVYRHYDITGKACPKPFLDENKWSAFKKSI